MSRLEVFPFDNISAASGNSKHDPTEASRQQLPEDGNPFSFSPQIVRLHREHDMFEDGDIHRHLYLQDLYASEAEDRTTLSVSEFPCHISGCSALFSSLGEYEHHYNSLHRNVCSSCRRCLPSARLLDIHIQEWHDSLFAVLAQKQDMYLCLVEGCGQKFRTGKQRKDHLIRIHKYPPDFRFDKLKKERGNKGGRGQEQKVKVIEAVNDVCESEGVCEVLCNPMSDQPEEEESMEICEKEAPLMEDMPSPVQDSEVNALPLKPQYSRRIPKTVCFGHGSSRSFRGQRGRRK
uniref:Zinc finger protein 511 n=1 Tax=Oryzias latipes TaxID=8090 RepID=A0A3P9JY02_ORYLA